MAELTYPCRSRTLGQRCDRGGSGGLVPTPLGAPGQRPSRSRRFRASRAVRRNPARGRGIPRAEDDGHRDHGPADRARRRVDPAPGRPAPRRARAWGNQAGIPVYDVALVGYPQADARVQRAPQGQGRLPSRPARGAVSRWRRCRRPGRAACAPGRRCRPWSSSRSARPSGSAGPAMSMCAQASPSGTNSRRNTPPCSMWPARSMPALTWEMSATSESMPLRTSSGSGIGQAGSPTRSPAARTRSHSAALAHHAGDPLAQRDHLAAGQGGRLDQVVRVVLGAPGRSRRPGSSGPRRRC